MRSTFDCNMAQIELQSARSSSGMVLLWNRTHVCIVWHLLGAARLALSNLDGEARATEESRNLLPGFARLDSQNKLVIQAVVPSEEQRFDQYGNIPEKLSRRKAELKSMEDDKNEIMNRINLLRAPRGPACLIKSQLKELLDSLGTPIQDRVFWLNGRLGSTVTSLLIKPKIKDPGHAFSIFKPSFIWLKLAVTRILNAVHLSSTASQYARSTRSSMFFQALKNALPLILGGGIHEPTIPRSTLGEHSSTNVHFLSSQADTFTSKPGREAVRDMSDRADMEAWSFLEKHLTGFPTEDNVPRQSSPDSHPANLHGTATGPLVPSDDVASASSPITRNQSLDDRELRLGKLKIQSSRTRGELHGDELSIVKDILANERFKIWTSLEGKLLDFESWSPGWYKTQLGPDVKFKLQFLECLLLLGDFIHKYRLLPAEMIAKMRIFGVSAIWTNLQNHIWLSLSIWGGKYFDKAESVIPQLEFLTTSPTLKHFHRAIKALPPQYHVYLVFEALCATMHSGPQYFDSGGPSPRFSRIDDGFCQLKFLIGVQQLCEKLRRTPEMDYAGPHGDLLVVILIQRLILFFHNPTRTILSDQERLEFQMTFYMLDFLDKYFQQIMKAMQQRGEITSILNRQLEFMRHYLKFFQGRVQEPTGYRYVTLDPSFGTLSNDGSLEDAILRKWIKKVPLALFHHDSWLNLLRLRRTPNFNLWMG
ncbi:hypothetical protein Pst134EA_000880 [Puccinia striiformis f. sp. tritici]|uniref:hypothetical protein n=2 Tax=Puccinia striiformis f. sp. tritici TaxID=168172 RepID=UPI002007706D|nr:hypothetical protein Pst134EA_000880 [Puccinia striiformis f. sp. tritici]KAH9473815.1 hypothetical protein Pst134EA_000880 [Puccinia striiformis f. sp. tritici]